MNIINLRINYLIKTAVSTTTTKTIINLLIKKKETFISTIIIIFQYKIFAFITFMNLK